MRESNLGQSLFVSFCVYYNSDDATYAGFGAVFFTTKHWLTGWQMLCIPHKLKTFFLGTFFLGQSLISHGAILPRTVADLTCENLIQDSHFLFPFCLYYNSDDATYAGFGAVFFTVKHWLTGCQILCILHKLKI